MSEVDLRQMMEQYSNDRIMNIVKQRNSYSEKQFELAKSIAKERKIVSTVKLDKVIRYAELRRKTEIAINNGSNPASELSNLYENYGVPFEDAKDIIDSIKSSREEKLYDPNKYYRWKMVGFAIEAYIMIKIIISILTFF